MNPIVHFYRFVEKVRFIYELKTVLKFIINNI